MPLLESGGRSFILTTIYRSIMRGKLRFIAYIILSICCALLLTFTLGQNYDGKAQKIRGASKRPVRQVDTSNQLNKDPFVNRPRIQTRNGHLIIEASPDKNIDFKTSGSRGTVTINGHKLDQLLDVTKALERSVLGRRSGASDGDADGDGGLFIGKDIQPDDSSQFEIVLRRLLDSSDKLAKFEKRFKTIQDQINGLTKQITKATKIISKLKGVLNKIGKKQEDTEVKLKRNDCFNSENGQGICKNGATCIDTYDGYKCLCTPQFEGSTCEDDVDECSKFRGTDLGCQNGAKCINFAGGYTCECPPQYHGIHCTEQHDDCSLSTSRSLCGHGKCISLARNTPNQANYDCACDQGWTNDGRNPACVIDINECMVGQTTSTNISTTSLQVSSAWSNSLMAAYPCSQNPFVECINLLGSFECGPCPPGYTGNGRVCRDINECITNNGGCSMSPLVECINTQGSHRCGSCPPGYSGDGVNCWRTSACEIEPNGGCHPMAKCVELNGVSMSSRFCICNYPFVGDGVGPTGCAQTLGPTYFNAGANEGLPIRSGNDSTTKEPTKRDDCNPNPCSNDAKCQNTDTSFECICSIGWSGRLCDEIGSICGGKYFVSNGGLTFPKDGSFNGLIKANNAEAGTEMATKNKDNTNISKHYNCRWSISVSPSNMSIKLTLSNLANINNYRNRPQYWLANSTTGHQIQVPTCTEYLDIREILDVSTDQNRQNRRKLLAKICIDGHGGNLVSVPRNGRKELTLLSESNNAELEYSFSATRTQFGEPSLSFTLNWTKTEPPCGGELEVAEFGSISSPKFPEFYGAGTECRYLIHVPNDKRIRVQFGELNLLQGTRHPTTGYSNYDDIGDQHIPCADSLTILDGSFGRDRPVLFKYCANNVTLVSKMQNSIPPIISSSSTIELILDSRPDSTEPLMRPKQKRGFYLTYAAEPTTPGCGGLYTTKSGIIKSIDYEADMSLTDSATSTEDQRQNSQLSYYLENYVDRYSSSNRPTVLDTSLANHNLRSMNSSEKFTGYKQPYKVRCEYEIRPSKQGRDHKVSIDWLEMPRRVAADSSNSLTLWSRKLRCARNRLIVYDGNPLDNSNRTELATFCAGDKYNSSSPLLVPIVSTGHSLILVYETTNDPYALDRNAQLLANAAGSNYPTGFRLHYSTICTAIYHQFNTRVKTKIRVELDEEVGECIYHIILPPNNTISLNINPYSDFYSGYSLPTLADGSCAVQAIFMDGAIQGGKLALIGAERQLKTYGLRDEISPVQNMETRIGDNYFESSTIKGYLTPGTPNSYWQYSKSSQANDIKEFELCSLSNLNIDSTWNHLSLLFRLKNHQSASQIIEQKTQAIFADGNRPLASTVVSGQPVKFSVKYRAKPSCGGIIDQPREGSIKLESERYITSSIAAERNLSSSKTKNNCSWILKAPTNQQIQLRFDVPSVEIKKRFDEWLSWSNKNKRKKSESSQKNDSETEIDDQNLSQTSTFNCAQVYEELVELYEPSLNRTRYICPNDLNVQTMALTNDNKETILNQQSFWSTQSNIVYIRVRNSSEIYNLTSYLSLNETLWPGKKDLNGSIITLNYKFVSSSSRQCGGRLIQDSGIITSPMYPYNYPSNANCVWIIQANPSQQIRLNFSKFEIEKQGACSFDYLELRNGPTSDSPLIGRFCNQDLQSRIIISHSNFMWLKFKSDTSLNRPGFELYFDGAQTGCGGKSTSSSGQIDSPNYPLPFAHSSDCKWTIEVVESSKIELTIQDLDLSSGTGNDCRINGTKTDYLEIFDSSSMLSEKSLGRYCHKSQLNMTTIISRSNKLSLDFKSQALDNSRGFRITYRTLCNPIELFGFQGVIESPGYPVGYQAHSNCGWTIRAPLGSNLSLAIVDLDLEDSFGDYASTLASVTLQSKTATIGSLKNKCRDDFVEIYSIYPPILRQNATTKNITAIIESQRIILEARESKKFKSKIPKYGRLNNVLCGLLSNIPDRERIINLDTNLAHINFESDRSVESRGFRIEWKAEGCGGLSETKMDSLSSISYHEQAIYQNRPTECLWTVSFPKQYAHIELSIDSDMRIPNSNKGFIRDVCEDASFTIYDGSDEKAPILTKNCDSQNRRESITSSSSEILVKFFSSGQHNYGRGFALEAYATRRSSCLSNDFDLKSPFNQVGLVKKSPKYPDLYDTTQYNCMGLVTVHRNSRIKFNIDELDIPISDSDFNSGQNDGTAKTGLIDSATCKKSGNYLMVKTSISKSVEEAYCGKIDKTKEKDLARSSIVFEEATVWEEFLSKGIFRGRWQISYTRLCGSLIWIETQREFITPNYPSRPNWPKSTNEDELDRSENVCIWSLKSRNNRGQGKLYLNIINFIESDNKKRLNVDCLRVYEGVELDLKRNQFNITDFDSKLTPRLKICKQSDIKYSSLQFASQSNELYVVISGNAIAKFQVKPFENGCGGEYNMKKTEFASLGYPQPYPELLDCHYFIRSSPGSKINLKFLNFALPEGETQADDDGDQSTKCDNVDYVEVRQISIQKKLNLKLNPITSSFKLGIWSDLGFFLEQLNKRINVTTNISPDLNTTTSQSMLNQTILTPKKQRLFDIAKTYYLFEELYNGELNSMRFSTIRTSFISLDSFYENSKLIGRYCGSKKPNLNNIQLFDEVLVRFRSHGEKPSSQDQSIPINKKPNVAPKGFLAEYEIQYGGLIQLIDKETMDEGSFISSPSYPIKIRYNNSIRWTFETKLDSIIQFDLISLDLGSTHLDCVDSLKIYDGLNVETSIRLTQACGHLRFTSLQFLRSLLQAKSTPASSSKMLNINALPVYEALDPKVKSSLIQSVRTSSNVATIVYDNFKTEGSFLLRYKAINKKLARQEQLSSNSSEENSIIDENEVILGEKQDFVYSNSINDLSKQNASKLCSNTYQLDIYDNLARNNKSTNSSSSNEVTLLSPNYPYEPKQSIECHWLIYTQDDTVINLSIDLINSSSSDDDKSVLFDREDKDQCFDQTKNNGHQSYIVIHDGASRLAPIIARLCLPAPPKQIISSGRHMLIRYVHNRINPALADSGQAVTQPNPIEPRSFLFKGRASVGQCGGQYHVASFATITDRPPNSGRSFYSNNLNCKYYVFAANQDKVLTIYNSQSEIDLAKEPTNENCTVGDYIEIRDLPIQSQVLEFSPQSYASQQGRLLGRFCAGRKLETIESPSSAISIEFKTDNQNTGKGWILGIVSADPYLACPFGRRFIKFDEPFGMFTSPNWPHGLSRERHCQYGFEAPMNQSILITFIRLNRPTIGENLDVEPMLTSANDNNKCEDNFDYLDDNEASLSYRFSNLRELNSPISGSLLRDHIQQVPCRSSSFKLNKPSSKLEPLTTTREESNISPEELSNLLKIDKPGLKKLTIDEYYQLLQKAPEEPFEIRTSSHTLLMDYQTKSLLPKQGFVAVYRTVDDRKFDCGGELSYSESTLTSQYSNNKPSNYFESANFNLETQPTGKFIQCDWSIEAQQEKYSQYDRSLAVGISYSMVPTANLGDISNTYIVFQTLEIPSIKPERSLFDDSLEPEEKEKLNEYCGLNRIILTDNWFSWPSLVACGNLTNARKWHLLSYGDRKLSIRTKNLRHKKQDNGDTSIYRGVRGYLYEKNCLQVERIIGEGIRLRSNRGFPNSSYTPGICRWRLRLDGGNYQLSFDRVSFRPPENYIANKTGMACDTNDPELDYIEIRASESSDSPILARYCIYNQMKEKEKAMMLNMESYLVVTFVAGVKQLSLGSETFNSTTLPANQKGINKSQIYGFDMEIVRISNETMNDFCRRDRKESIYWFIRSYSSYYYDTFTPATTNFLYPKNVNCLVDMSIEGGMRFNMTFRGLFDIEPSKDCRNDYIQIDDIIMNSLQTENYTSAPEIASNKTHLTFRRKQEPILKKIGRWCGRTKPNGNFLSSSNQIRITFHSNDRIEGKGFNLVYSRINSNNTGVEAKQSEYIYL